MKMKQSVNFIPTPVYLANERAYNEGWPTICNEGGSRSSKSYSIIQLLVIIALKESNKRISVVSHSLPHIKRGAYRDFVNIMQGWGIWSDDNFSFTDFVYKFPNGSYIELFGLEDESKARGPGRDILFLNEANLISRSLYDQLSMRTTQCEFLDWNPADFVSWVYEVGDNPRNKKIHSTYKNNRSNLTQKQIDQIEGYKNLPDDFWWKVYGLGLRGASKEIIYTKWMQYSEQPTGGDTFFAIDFGYTNPTAMVQITHYEGVNYVRELIYKSAITTDELIPMLKQLVPSNAVLYCDSAEPKTIEMLYRAGINAKKAEKDVWTGIIAVKSYPLQIHNASSNLIAELQSYKWMKDKNDNITEKPVKSNDHLCDAMRYGIFTHLTKPSTGFAAAIY